MLLIGAIRPEPGLKLFPVILTFPLLAMFIVCSDIFDDDFPNIELKILLAPSSIKLPIVLPTIPFSCVLVFSRFFVTYLFAASPIAVATPLNTLLLGCSVAVMITPLNQNPLCP